MADINIKGRYRIYTHDGTSPFDFTTYANNLCVVRRPNEVTFVTLRQYVPGPGVKPFTTFEPGSSYTIVTKSNTAEFTMGPYTRSDRLPSSTTIKSPIFYIGLDRNSIPVPLSSYALGVNSPLSTIRTSELINGFYTTYDTFDSTFFKQGFTQGFTHLKPGSSYELRNRVPFTLFAPLQSEMGDAFTWGNNEYGQFGLGHLQNLLIRQESNISNITLTAYNMFGVWEDIQAGFYGSIYALSAHGEKFKLFVTGNNFYGQLGTGNQNDLSVFTQLTGDWLKVQAGANFALALSSNGKLFSVGQNDYGQLGLGSNVLSASTFTQVNENTYLDISAGTAHTLVLDSNGALYSCGSNSYGQLGRGTKTSAEFTLTREVSAGTFQLIRAGSSKSIALSSGRMLGCGYQTFTNNYGTNDSLYYSTFVPEVSGFTDIVDVGMSGTRYILINRSNDPYWWYTGSNTSLNKAPGIQNVSFPWRSYTVNKAQAQKGNNFTMPIYDLTTGSTNFYFISDGYLKKISGSSLSDGYFLGNYNKLFGARFGYDQVFIALSGTNHFRPTPSPTVTPSPTPSPVPFTPYNDIEISIFGSSFQLNTSSTSNQNRVFSTPGNLSNDFTRESMNENLIPPGNSYLATFDYEKTTTYNNIVGVSIIMNYNQNPSGREYCRYLFRKTGSSWTYSLLPSQFDALSDPNSTLDYRGSETGTDTIFITPPNPQYANTSQGLYSLMFMRDEAFYEAISYNRGVDWDIYSFISLNSESQFDLYGLKNKIFYSRTRESNYKVRAVGYTGSSPMGGFPDNSLYFSERFPNFTSPELIYDFSSRYAWGFDFKHDYFNIPTVVSVGATQSSFGVYLHRKINNTWQTSIIKDNITNLCYGPYYQVPRGISFYKRISSPVISVEFDSTNPNLIYIAYLKHSIYFPTAYNDPAFIGVLCYNMQTNSIVFDEVPVSATYETGALTKTDSQYIDIPSLYFDTSNNTLNLFFSGPIYTQNPVDVFYRYYQTRRLGNNSWITPNYLFTDSIRPGAPDGTYMTNSWELRTKY